MAVAVITGASKGLGRVLAAGLAARGWSLVIDARDEECLARAAEAIAAAGGPGSRVVVVAGDVSDFAHRARLVAAAGELGGTDLLVNNASILGPSPPPQLADYSPEDLRRVYDVNVVAPAALIADFLPLLRAAGVPRVLNVTSDASVEAYPGWGGYGSSKAALDHLSAILAVEEPAVTVWAIDPGDMRTQMHQDAFPGEDISDRPLPESVVPALIDLIGSRRPSGRYRAADLLAPPAEPPAYAGHGAEGAAS